jgi:biotin carboxyl carrier protein
MSEKPPPRPPRPTRPPRPVSGIGAPVRAVVGGAAGPPPPIPRPPPRVTASPVPTPSSGEEQTKAVSGHTLESAELRVVRGTFRGMSCALGAGTVFIGRSSECDLPLKGAQGVSRRHCKVQYLGNRFVIIDLESRNGTIVNGQSVERKILEKGDRISLGDEVIEFVVESLSDLRADAALGDATDIELAPRSFAAAATDPAQPIAPRGHEAAFGVEHTERVRRTSPETQQETLPPRAAATAEAPDDVDVAPPIPATDERPAPSTFSTLPDQPAIRRRAGPVWIAAGLVVVGAAAALWFIIDAAKDAPASPESSTSSVAVMTTTTATVPAPTATTTAPAATTTTTAPAATATPPTAVAPTEPTATTTPLQGEPPLPPPAPTAPSAEPTASDDVGAAPVFVRAASTGRVQSLEVVVGEVVEAGDVVAMLSSDAGALARKLDALRKEEREFAAAAASDPAAKADLAAIRSELQKLESKLKPRPVTAPVGGTVVEIVADQGSLIRDGMPLVSIRAARPSR